MTKHHKIYTRAELNCLDAIQRGEMTAQQAADVLGVHETTVFQWMKWLGIKAGLKARRRHELSIALEDIYHGKAIIEEVAKKFGIQPVTVRIVLNQTHARQKRPHCQRCEILLEAAPAGKDGLCGWCIREMEGRDVSDWLDISSVTSDYRKRLETNAYTRRYVYIEEDE